MATIASIAMYEHKLNAEQRIQVNRAIHHFHEAQDAILLIPSGEREIPVRKCCVKWSE